MKTAVCVVIAYLLGSINPAILMGRARGIDIKKEGSGNAGTTNTLRVMGKKAAGAVLLCDVLKGVAAVFIGSAAKTPLSAYFCALAVFAGHIWPCFFRFKGGKGVATAFGAVLAVNWRIALAALAVVAVITVLTRMMSAGSVCGAFSLPVFSLVFEKPFFFWGLAIGLVIILKHRSNIKRILAGTESKLSFKK